METISNEEKAIEFATSYDGKIISFAHLAALQMGQWKDEQILSDDDDKLATEVKVDGVTITPPQGYLIGKVTHVKDSLIVELKNQS
jgi:hypothetical protein